MGKIITVHKNEYAQNTGRWIYREDRCNSQTDRSVTHKEMRKKKNSLFSSIYIYIEKNRAHANRVKIKIIPLGLKTMRYRK